MFFDAIEKYSRIHDPYADYDVILDRLYKRYLRLEELSIATTLLNRIRDVLMKIVVSQEYIDFAMKNEDSTSFDIKANNLAGYFGEYFRKIEDAIKCALYNHEERKKEGRFSYKRVTICHTDIVPATIADMRPDELYDNLEGEPYWMREPVMDWDPKDYQKK
jgi:hypothetical protein